MLVTVICDASFCPDTCAAGYGFFIVSDRGRLGGGDILRMTPTDVTAAEMFAIVNSVAIAFRERIAEFGDHVRVQTDCQAAILALLGKRNLRHGQETKACETLHGIMRRYAATYDVVHVKGHTRREEARYVTNRLCDVRAKNFMRQRRKDLAAMKCRRILQQKGII